MTDPRSLGDFGAYRLIRLIGRGGMGEVYEAFDRRRNRTVALKLLPPELSSDPTYVARFRREAEIAAQLGDPHIIPIHDYGEIDGTLFIDMRLVQGRDLRELLRQSGRLPAPRALAIGAQVAEALDAAQRSGLEHRDVKPENILVTDQDFAYLADFGIALREADRSLTSDGSTIGSFDYLAPERFGPGHSGSAADQYALACVLYECLTGTAPYHGESVAQKAFGHLNSPVPRLDESLASSATSSAVARAMAKDPTERFASAGAFLAAARSSAPSADAVHTAATQVAAVPHQATREDRAGAPAAASASTAHGSGRTRSVVAAVLAVLLLLGGAAWWMTSRFSSPGPRTSTTAGSDASGISTPSSRGSSTAPTQTSSTTATTTAGSTSSSGSSVRYPISNSRAQVAPVGGKVPPGVQAYANAVLAADTAQIVRRCWTYAPQRVRAQQSYRDDILEAFARNTNPSSTELGPGWGAGDYRVNFSYAEAESPFACPTVTGPGMTGTNAADAEHFLKRLNGRITGKPVHPADTIGGYWLICDPFPGLAGVDSRDRSSDARFFTPAEKAAIATLTAGPIRLSPASGGNTVVQPAGASSPSLTLGTHSVNLCLDDIRS